MTYTHKKQGGRFKHKNFNFFKVSSDITYNKKTIEGLVLKMLWNKVFKDFDAKTKEFTIRKLREKGDYDKLVTQLQKVKKEKLEHILNLVAEIMIAFAE